MNLANLNRHEKVLLRDMSRFLLKYTPYFAALLWGPFHFASSYSSGFCVWHRRLIWYHGITGVMVFLEMWIGFGEYRRILNAIFFLWGVTICAIVTYKIKTKQFCDQHDKSVEVPGGAD